MRLLLLILLLLSALDTAVSQTDTGPGAIPPPSQDHEERGRRTITSIVLSCISVIVTCTWVSVHPNVPSVRDSPSIQLRRKIGIMLAAFVVPELVIWWALKQWAGAKEISKRSKCTTTHAFFLLMGGFAERKIIDGKEDRISSFTDERVSKYPDYKVWFKNISVEDIQDHSKADGLTKAITLLQTLWFVTLCIARIIDPETDLTQLEVFTLALASLNGAMYSFWWKKPYDVCMPIVLNPITRDPPPANDVENQASSNNVREHGMIPNPASQDSPCAVNDTGDQATLDVCSPYVPVTRSQDPPCRVNNRESRAHLNGISLTFRGLSHGPANHRATSRNFDEESDEDDDDGTDTEPPRFTPNPLKEPVFQRDRNVGIKVFTAVKLAVVDSYEGMKDLIFDTNHARNEDDDDAVPTFYAPMALGHDARSNFFRLLPVLISIVFSAIHFVAWNYEAPTGIEKLLWRISTIVITTITVPLVICFMVVIPISFALKIFDYYLSMCFGVSSKSFNIQGQTEFFNFSKKSIFYLSLIFGLPYLIARLALFGLAIASIRSLSDAAYLDIEWTNYIPHIG